MRTSKHRSKSKKKRKSCTEGQVHRWLQRTDVGQLASRSTFRRSAFPNLRPSEEAIRDFSRKSVEERMRFAFESMMSGRDDSVEEDLSSFSSVQILQLPKK